MADLVLTKDQKETFLEFIEQIKKDFKAYITQNYKEPSLTQILDLWNRYMDYRERLGSLQAPSLSQDDPQYYRSIYNSTQNLRKQFFSDYEIEGLFGIENTYHVYTLKRMDVINDKKLSEAEKAQPKSAAPKFASLWSRPYRTRTAMLWLAWFGIVYSYYGIFMWLPSIVYSQGFAVVKTFEYVLIMTLAQLPGYYAAAWLVDVIGRKYTLSTFLLFSGVASYFFGHASTAATLMMWGSVMSFFNLGAWGVLYTYTPEQYPANIRAFGSGWAAAIGRIGGIAAPLAVTHMMVLENGFSYVFSMFTAVLLAVAAVILVLGEETKGKTLESIGL